MLCLVLLVLCICVLLAAVVANSRVKDDLSKLEDELVRLGQGGWHRGWDEIRCDDDGSCINREGTD